MQAAQNRFKLHSNYKPTGDQPQAIEELVKGFKEGNQFQTLLGVTGSGKTFTMANVIQQLNKPALVIAHNKTLAAQLYGEFKEYFPENAVEYFVSYYDYYQPEAYVPSSDTYIAKDSSVNEEIDKLRLSATASLIERKDVIIISSVSCIYGLGEPENFEKMMVSLRPGMSRDRDEVIRRLIDTQYTRNDMDFHRGTFRVRGDVLEIFPADRGETAVRVEFFGDEIDRITEIDVLTGEAKNRLEHISIFPASHYVVPQEQINRAVVEIEKELEERVRYFKGEDKLLEAQRIAERTNFDIEMLRETGFCSGIDQMLFVSATPNVYEKEHELLRAEQIIRPTGLLDPKVEVRPVEGQIDDLIGEVHKEIEAKNKVLITTLTKKMAEDLTDYMREVGIRVKYLHSDIDTLERAEIIRDLRLDVFDVLVGINLLREGLDIPEITLVAILDADKEGFLRSETSLIQTIGRAARNAEGHVIMYADSMTDSMRAAIEETNRRRAKQEAYNEAHGITPTTIRKSLRELISISKKVAKEEYRFQKDPESMSKIELEKQIGEVQKKMQAAAAELNFEAAAELRDKMIELKKNLRDM